MGDTVSESFAKEERRERFLREIDFAATPKGPLLQTIFCFEGARGGIWYGFVGRLLVVFFMDFVVWYTRYGFFKRIVELFGQSIVFLVMAGLKLKKL